MSKVGSSRRPPGFTLIEALLSIVVLAGIAGLVVPSFARAYQNSLLYTTARSIAATLRYTRASAISLNQERSLQLDAQGKYFVLDANNTIEVPESIEVSRKGSQHRVNADNLRITFYPHGGSSGGGFVLRNRKKYLLVHVNPLTGNVGVNEHAPD